MDEEMIHKWSNLLWIPGKNVWNLGIMPLLILDSYSVHMMGSIVNTIQAPGIEVQHIPGGLHLFVSIS